TGGTIRGRRPPQPGGRKGIADDAHPHRTKTGRGGGGGHHDNRDRVARTRRVVDAGRHGVRTGRGGRPTAGRHRRLRDGDRGVGGTPHERRRRDQSGTPLARRVVVLSCDVVQQRAPCGGASGGGVRQRSRGGGMGGGCGGV